MLFLKVCVSKTGSNRLRKPWTTRRCQCKFNISHRLFYSPLFSPRFFFKTKTLSSTLPSSRPLAAASQSSLLIKYITALSASHLLLARLVKACTSHAGVMMTLSVTQGHLWSRRFGMQKGRLPHSIRGWWTPSKHRLFRFLAALFAE